MTRAAGSEDATEHARIRVELELDGDGAADVQCEAPLLRHLLTLWCKAAGFDLELRGGGTLDHHALEAAALSLGRAWRMAYGPTTGTHVAYDFAPRRDALVLVAVDLADRPNYVGDVPAPLWDQFLRTFATEARLDLHVQCMRGRTVEHTLEALFTAFGLALRNAMGPRPASARKPKRAADNDGVVVSKRRGNRARLEKTSDEVMSSFEKKDLPEVTAAKERDRKLRTKPVKGP